MIMDLTKTHVVSFSGGRTSAYLVHLMEFYRKYCGADVRYIFMDTGAEHPKTYAFIRNLVKHWGIPLVCLRTVVHPEMGKGSTHKGVSVDDIGTDLQPWSDMLVKYGAPYAVGAMCTARMKTDPFNSYCKDVMPAEYITWLGIRDDEPRRLKRREGFAFLADISDFDKDDVIGWWKTQPFDLGIEEHLGNCVFCIKKSNLKLVLASREEPEMYDQFVALTEGDTVRTTGRMHNHQRMYRKSLHLTDIIKIHSADSVADIRSRLRHTRSSDTGSCTESCEVFNLDDTP